MQYRRHDGSKQHVADRRTVDRLCRTATVMCNAQSVDIAPLSMLYAIVQLFGAVFMSDQSMASLATVIGT